MAHSVPLRGSRRGSPVAQFLVVRPLHTSMKLTPLQRKFLNLYMSYHTAGLTFGQILRHRWPRLLLFVVTGLCLFFFAVPAHAVLGWLSIGVCIGLFYADIGSYRSSNRIWPVFDKIIDWKRVSELLDSNDKDVA